MGMVKNLCGITSMQQMTAAFNDENCIQNISDFTGNLNKELPHYVTLKNHYLITQIADIFWQLYVYRKIKKIRIKKTEKIYLLTC